MFLLLISGTEPTKMKGYSKSGKSYSGIISDDNDDDDDDDDHEGVFEVHKNNYKRILKFNFLIRTFVVTNFLIVPYLDLKTGSSVVRKNSILFVIILMSSL